MKWEALEFTNKLYYDIFNWRYLMWNMHMRLCLSYGRWRWQFSKNSSRMHTALCSDVKMSEYLLIAAEHMYICYFTSTDIMAKFKRKQGQYWVSNGREGRSSHDVHSSIWIYNWYNCREDTSLHGTCQSAQNKQSIKTIQFLGRGETALQPL